MRIVRAEQARIDTFDIWDYIAIENSAAVADGMLARISGALEVLAFAPMIGRKRTDLRGQPRSFSVRPYTVIYGCLMETASSCGASCMAPVI